MRTVPTWRDQDFPTQGAGSFGFHGSGVDRLAFFGRGVGDRYAEFGGGMFARRSPPRGQYEFGRSHSFESKMGYGPRFPTCGARTSPARREMITRGGHSFDRMDFSNPTFEHMPRHWFYSFCTNPDVESIACSRSQF
jgi:hypothetical protein